MASSLVRRCTLVLTLAALAGCHDVPQAPKVIPPTAPQWVVITMDDGVTDYPSWGGLDLLRSDSELDFVTAETEFGTLHYGGCVQDCQDPTRWFVGTVDSGVYRGLGENASSVRTAAGIVVAYEDWQTPVEYVKIGTCGGGCYHRAGWQFGDIRTGLLGSFNGTHSHVLAADANGGLNLLYHDPHDLNLYYAHCAAACTDSSAWQSMLLDSGVFQVSDVAISVGSTGVVRVLAEGDSANALTYFSCDTGCMSRGNWGSVVLATGVVGHTPSILVGPSGALYVSYGRAPAFGTCTTACLSLASWSFTQLPDSNGSDVALALDGSEHPWLAVSHGTRSYYGGKSVVMHCDGACGTPGSWQRVQIDSLGDGLDLALVVDAQSNPHVFASGYGVHYAQRPDSPVVGAVKRSGPR